MIDANGKWVVPAKYNQIYDFRAGTAIVLKDNRYGLINENGKEIVPTVYQNLQAVVSTNYTYPDHCTNTNNSQAYWREIQNSPYSVFVSPVYFIVKKNNLWGIIDTNNHEVAPCKYWMLERFINNVALFFCQDGTRGFLDVNGVRGTMSKEQLQMGSEQVFPGLGFYSVFSNVCIDSKKRKYKTVQGLFNDSGRFVLPIEFDSINKYAGYCGIIEAYKNGKTFYYKRDGTKLFDDGYVVPEARCNLIPLLALNGNSPANNGKKWGIINYQGKNNIDFSYDSLARGDYYALGGGWKFKSEDKWGLMDYKGKKILDAEYDDFSMCWRMSDDSLFETVVIAKKENHWGAISTSGIEIMPFVYEEILGASDNSTIFWSENSTDLLYFTKNQPVVALYNYNPEAEKKKAEQEWNERKKRNDSTLATDPKFNYDFYEFEYVYPFEEGYENEGGYRYASGQITRLDYNSYDPHHLHHYEFGVYLKLEPGIEISHVERVPFPDKDLFYYSRIHKTGSWYGDSALGNYPDYEYEEEYGNAPLIFKRINGKLVECFAANFLSDSVHMYFRVEIPLVSKSPNEMPLHSPEIFRSDGKIILPAYEAKQADLIEMGKKQYLRITDRSGEEGLMDLDGKFLLDTLYNLIYLKDSDIAWVRKINNDENCAGTWNEYSFSQKKLLLSEDEQLMNDVSATNGSFIESTKSGTGVYNAASGKFDLPSTYRAVYNLNLPNDKFAAVTCHKHLGIFYSNGKMISDTIWNSIVEIPALAQSSWEGGPTTHERFILSNEKSWAFYDTQNGILNGDSTQILKILNFTSEVSSIDDYNLTPGCPWLKASGLSGFKMWQQKLLFDSIYFSSSTIDFRRNKDDRRYDCPCKLDYSNQDVFFSWQVQKTNYQRIHHTVYFQNDSVLSYVKGTSYESYSEYKWMSVYGEWQFSYYNIFLFPSGSRVLTLDSIFVGEEWKKILENTAMNYLEAHPGLNGDCSNPSAIPQILNQMFSVNTSGITFYPHWNYSDDNRKKEQITFTIPWDQLKPYLRQDVASKIGVK